MDVIRYKHSLIVEVLPCISWNKVWKSLSLAWWIWTVELCFCGAKVRIEDDEAQPRAAEGETVSGTDGNGGEEAQPRMAENGGDGAVNGKE